jgi:hypothetical protein
MKKKLILAVLIAVVAPALWLGSGGGPGWADNNLGFGQKLAGGWLAELDVGYDVEIMLSFTADGGLMANGTLRNDALGRYNTTSHGSWKRTGPNKIESVTLLFIQDNDGKTVMYEKVLLDLTLKAHRAEMAGTGLIQLILAGNDPLDPKAQVYMEIPITETLRRIQ